MEKNQHISLEVQIEDGEGKRRSGAKMDPWNPQNMSEQNRGTIARLKQAQEQKLHRIQRNFEKNKNKTYEKITFINYRMRMFEWMLGWMDG